MRRWVYIWLPRIFGCHCRADRSFFYTWNGRRHKAPICARCTGELVGILAGIVSGWFWLPEWWLCVVLMIPMVADGMVQLCTRYESTNLRRLVTGAAFGYGLYSLFALITLTVYRLGLAYGASASGR